GLVADRVEDEGEVDEGIDLVGLQQPPDRGRVADVGADELRLPAGRARWAHVDVDDALGRLTVAEDLDQAGAHVAPAAGDQVAHGRPPSRAGGGGAGRPPERGSWPRDGRRADTAP